MINKLLTQSYIPIQLKKKLQNFLDEELRYAADEVVETAEYLLSYINGLSIMAYIRQENQSEQLNQQIVELFYGTHSNPGMLYRSITTSCLKLIREKDAKNILAKQFLDENGNYRQDLNALSELRNQVMHGLFVLPPKENKQNMDKLCILIDELLSPKNIQLRIENNLPVLRNVELNPLFFIDKDGDIRFFEDFKACLNGSDKQFESCYQFNNLFRRTSQELTLAFLESGLEFVKTNEEQESIVNSAYKKVNNFIKQDKGNLWITGEESIRSGLCSKIYAALKRKSYNVAYWKADNIGLRYSSNLVLKVVCNKLGVKFTNEFGKLEKLLSKCSKEEIEKTIIIIDNAHKRQFSDESFLQVTNMLYKIGIRIIALSPYYPTMEQYFNAHIQTPVKSYSKLSSSLKDELFTDYLYDSGLLQTTDLEIKQHYIVLEKAVTVLWRELNDSSYVNLRNFASNKKNFSTVVLDEAANLLSPIIEQDRIEFEPTEWDLLLDRPKKETESSYIFDILGRTDISLAYKARICIHPKNIEKWKEEKRKLLRKYKAVRFRIEYPFGKETEEDKLFAEKLQQLDQNEQ